MNAKVYADKCLVSGQDNGKRKGHLFFPTFFKIIILCDYFNSWSTEIKQGRAFIAVL